MSNIIVYFRALKDNKEKLYKINEKINREKIDKLDVITLFAAPFFLCLIYYFNMEIENNTDTFTSLIFISTYIFSLFSFFIAIIFINKSAYFYKNESIQMFFYSFIFLFLIISCLFTIATVFMFAPFDYLALIDAKNSYSIKVFFVLWLFYYFLNFYTTILNAFNFKFKKGFKEKFISEKNLLPKIKKEILELENKIENAKEDKDSFSTALSYIEEGNLCGSDYENLKAFIASVKSKDEENLIIMKKEEELKKELKNIINIKNEIKNPKNLTIENN